MNGIDVSYAQGYINWHVMADKIDFAILRASRGRVSAEPTPKIDDRFRGNQSGCEKYNIPYGVYCFSYATSVDRVKAEAEYTLSLIKGHKLGFPVYFDFEYASADYYRKATGKDITPTTVCKYAKTFCEIVRLNGYVAGIYTNPDYIARYYGNEIVQNYELWLADWRKNGNKQNAKLWQTGAGSVGSLEKVDTDICYFDYPAYMAKNSLNGYPKAGLLDIHSIATEVIEGKWGNGEIRKEKLQKAGYSYKEVQAEVNKMLAYGK